MVKNIIPGQRVTKEKLHRARELRSEMTPAEKLLWQELRANKLGVHFRRQQVIAGFIVDFYCHSGNLVIEIDGGIHIKQKQDDSERENALKEMGLRVVRCRNEEVVKDLPKVLEKIRASLQNKETALAKTASQ
jgi:very-short-patch-repair endonuclease